MSKNKYHVYSQADPKNPPQPHEWEASQFLANSYFHQDVIFLRSGARRTPDLLINGKVWELKSPQGKSKTTMENTLKTARKQSRRLVLDFSRLKLFQQKAIANVLYYMKKYPRQFEEILVITKQQEVIRIWPPGDAGYNSKKY